MTAPDFLVIGHAAKDAGQGSWRLGGTVAYASRQAARLGLRAAVVTRAAPDVDVKALLPDVLVHLIPSETTTTFENRYVNGRRGQHVRDQALPIGAEMVLLELRRAKLVLLGPLLGEVPLGLARLFPCALVGLCAQGWLRDVRPDGLVVRRPWPESASPRGAGLVIASEEDIEGDKQALALWVQEAPIVVITEGKGGARLYAEGRWRRIAAFPHEEVDPAGAGDVFAAAFMIAFNETQDVAAAARFAAAAAGLSVEAAGLAGVPSREEIERVLAEHPEVTLE